MKSAEPRSRERTYRRMTRYEVVLRHEGGRPDVTVGFTARTTRGGLTRVAQSRGAEILDHTSVTDADRSEYIRDSTGRWWLTLGPSWRVGFTGRTERDVRNDTLHATEA